MLDDKKEQLIAEMAAETDEDILNSPKVVEECVLMIQHNEAMAMYAESIEHMQDLLHDSYYAMVTLYRSTTYETKERSLYLERLKTANPETIEAIINIDHHSLCAIRETYKEIMIVDEIDTYENRQKTWDSLIELEDACEDEIDDLEDIVRTRPIFCIVTIDEHINGLNDLRAVLADHHNRPSFLSVQEPVVAFEESEEQIAPVQEFPINNGLPRLYLN